MSDPVLPPERPLSDQARAVRKAELLRAVDGGGGDDGARPRAAVGRRWVVPAIAAAAVLAVVGVVGAVLVGGDDPESSGVPAGAPSTAASDPSSPSDAPTSGLPDLVDPAPSVSVSSGPESESESESAGGGVPDGFPRDKARGCDRVRGPVRDAGQLASIELGETTVRLYGDDTQWYVCDEWASLDGGDATLFAAHRFTDDFTVDQLGLSMNFSMDQDGVGEYVAGGALPEGVESITYTFPDGHVEKATLRDGMWAVAYFATEPPMDGSQRVRGSATVEVVRSDASVSGGSSGQGYNLPYPQFFCSQTNHGC